VPEKICLRYVWTPIATQCTNFLPHPFLCMVLCRKKLTKPNMKICCCHYVYLVLTFSVCDDKTDDRNEEYSLLGSNAMKLGWCPPFWSILPPFSESKSKISKKTDEAGGKLSLAYSLTLKMEAICSSKTSSSLQTTWCQKWVDCRLHSHCHENLKSSKWQK
jgi:hypothetical protein